MDMLVDNFEDLCKNFTTQKSINEGRETTPKGTNTRLVWNSAFSSPYILVKNFEEEILSLGNHVDTTWGWIVEKIQLLQWTCKYEFFSLY